MRRLRFKETIMYLTKMEGYQDHVTKCPFLAWLSADLTDNSRASYKTAEMRHQA